MSQQVANSMIDERIVEMKFDNKQFESGVKQTMSTLDRLKAALSFNTDTKGIEKIQNTFNNFNLTNAMGAVDAFSQKLSALQIFGKRIVENLADDFYGAIKKVENGIRGVFQQISTGGANRALNIEQAKFQLEGLHIAWEDIKGDIDYAVSGTAYGLDAAARVAAQLSASQVQVGDDMKAALRGISGVAAMTNSSYEEIGRIFSQVAGAGRLYTQDMLQMSSRGLNIAAALGQQLGHTEAEIREMVTKGQIDFKTFATAMNEAFGEQATKANNTYTGSLSNVKAALSRIGADIKAGHFETFRQVFVDLIPKLNEFKKAFKPVENVIIEVEAAVGRLLQKIISMVDVTKIVDTIAKPVEKFGRKILDVVNVVSEALGEINRPMEAMKEFAYMSREAAMQLGGFGDSVKYVTDKEEENIEMSEDMSKAFQAAKDIWNTGKYGNGQARIDALTAAGIDPKLTQKIIEEFIQNGYDWDAAIKKVSEDTANGVNENTERAEKLKKHVQTLATIFRNIKRTFSAVATSVGNIVKSLFKSITGSMKTFGVGDILIKITGAIADLAEKFMITEEKAAKLTKPINSVVSILKGIIKVGAGVIKTLAMIVYNIASFIYTMGSKILHSEDFNIFVDNVVSGIKTVIKNIKNLITSVTESKYTKQAFDFFKKHAVNAITYVSGAIVALVNLIGSIIPKIKTFAKYIISFFDFKSNDFENLTSQIDTTTGKFSYFKNFLINVVKNIRNAFEGTAKVIETIFTSSDVGILGKFVETFKAIIKMIIDLIKSIDFDLLNKFVGIFVSFVTGLIDKLKNLELADIFSIIKNAIIISYVVKLRKLIKLGTNLLAGIPSLFNAFTNVLNSTAQVNKSIARLNTAKAFAQIGKTVLMFAGAITLIIGSIVTVAEYIQQGEQYKSTFDHALASVSDIMGKVALVILSWIALSKTFDLATAVFTSKSKLHIPFFLQMGIFIASIGYTIRSVIWAIDDLANMDTTTLSTGGKRLIEVFKLIGVFFTAMSLITALINRFIGGGAADTTKGLYAISLVILSIAVSVDLLILSLAALAGLNKSLGMEAVNQAVDQVKSIIRTIVIMLDTLMIATAILEHLGSKQDLAKTFGLLSVLFLSIGAAMLGIMVVINDLTLSMKLFPEETAVAFATVWFFIASVLTIMGYIASKLDTVDKNGAKAMSALTGSLFALLAIIIAADFVATSIDNETELGALGVIFIGLIGIIDSMVRILEIVGKKKPKAGALGALAGVFASLGAILVPLIFFKNIKPADMGAIAAAMAGLVGIAALMGQTVKELSGVNPPKPGTLGALAGVFASLGAILVPLIFFTKINENGMYAIVGAMSALALIAATMSYTMKELSTVNQPKPGVLGTLAGVFASLGAILVPLIFFTNKNEWDAVAIGIAMAGLAGIVGLMSVVMKQIGTSKPDPWAIAALAAAFAGVAVILVPLQMLEGEDWGAYAAAMVGLAAVVGAFGFVMKAITSTTTPVQIIMVGAAMLAMSVGLAALGGVLGWVSSKVNIEGLIGLTVALGSLATIMTILGAVVGKMPEIGMGIALITAALFALAVQTLAVTAAINALMDRFPDFTKNIEQFARTIGSIPRFIKEGVIEPTEDTLECHSPSKVFERIGIYCIQGFLIGIKDTLVAGIKAIAKWLQDYIVTPICKFFGIASPSRLFAKIGAFLGEGLVNGFGETLDKKVDGSIILTGIKNKLNGQSFFNLGSLIGDDTGDGILSGISNKLSSSGLGNLLNVDSLKEGLNFDSLSEGFSLDNLINTDSMGELDFTGMSAAITQSTEEGIRGVNYADIFTAEDLIDNEELYNEVKNAGQSGLVAAADEVKRQRAFMGMYPTVQDFLNDIDNNVAPELAKAYHEGNAEVRSTIEAGLIQNYIDQATLSAEAYKYTKQAQIKAIKDAEIEVKKERESSDIYGPKTYEQTLDLKVNTLINGYTGKNVLGNLEKIFGNGNVLDGSVTFNVNEGQLKSNLTAVSTDISSSVNGLASTLKTELEAIKSRIDTFDNNQTGRTNTLASKMGEVGNSMNNLDVMLDTGALVGQLIGPIDNRLGEEARRKARG